MNADVFRAILAMDSYNRGYSPGINGLGGKDSKLGLATLGEDAETLLSQGSAQAAGFYASAYSWNGQTVISYRGTNFETVGPDGTFLSSPAFKYALNGWTLGAGFPQAKQAVLALAA
jgi:hypothetical protein